MEREEKRKGKGDKCAFSEGILTAPFPTSSPFLSAVSQLSALLSVLSFDLGSTLFSLCSTAFSSCSVRVWVRGQGTTLRASEKKTHRVRGKEKRSPVKDKKQQMEEKIKSPQSKKKRNKREWPNAERVEKPPSLLEGADCTVLWALRL